MKLREIMSGPVVRIHPEETVSVAARMLEHNNIGALPVCSTAGFVIDYSSDRTVLAAGAFFLLPKTAKQVKAPRN